MSSILNQVASFFRKTHITFDELKLPNVYFNPHFKRTFLGIFKDIAHNVRDPKILSENDFSYYLKYMEDGQLVLVVKYKDKYEIVIYSDGNKPSNIDNINTRVLYSEEDIIDLALADNALVNVRTRIVKEVEQKASNVDSVVSNDMVDFYTFCKAKNRLMDIKSGRIKKDYTYERLEFIFLNECVRNILLSIMNIYCNTDDYKHESLPLNIIYRLFKDQMKDVNFNDFDSIDPIAIYLGNKSFLIETSHDNSYDIRYIDLYECTNNNKKFICKVEFYDRLYHSCGRKNYLLSLLICMIRYSSLGDDIVDFKGDCLTRIYEP